MSAETKTETLITAMRILAAEINSADGVANAAIAEAADRLAKLDREVTRLSGITRWQCTCGGTDCAGQRENEVLKVSLATARASQADGFAQRDRLRIELEERTDAYNVVAEERDQVRAQLAAFVERYGPIDAPTARATHQQLKLMVDDLRAQLARQALIARR